MSPAAHSRVARDTAGRECAPRARVRVGRAWHARCSPESHARPRSPRAARPVSYRGPCPAATGSERRAPGWTSPSTTTSAGANTRDRDHGCRRPRPRRPRSSPDVAALLVAGAAFARWEWRGPGLRLDPRAARLRHAQGLPPRSSPPGCSASTASEAFPFARERRTVVPIDEIPDVLKKAVLASEDARFYEHEGAQLPGHRPLPAEGGRCAAASPAAAPPSPSRW